MRSPSVDCSIAGLTPWWFTYAGEPNWGGGGCIAACARTRVDSANEFTCKC